MSSRHASPNPGPDWQLLREKFGVSLASALAGHLLLAGFVLWMIQNTKVFRMAPRVQSGAALVADALEARIADVRWMDVSLAPAGSTSLAAQLPPSMRDPENDPPSQIALPAPGPQPAPEPAPVPKKTEPAPELPPQPKPAPKLSPAPQGSQPPPKLAPAPAPVKPTPAPAPSLRPVPKPAPAPAPKLSPAPALVPAPAPAPKPVPVQPAAVSLRPAPVAKPSPSPPIQVQPIPSPSPSIRPSVVATTDSGQTPGASPGAGIFKNGSGPGISNSGGSGMGTGSSGGSSGAGSGNEVGLYHAHVKATYVSHWQQPKLNTSVFQKLRVRTEIVIAPDGRVIRAQIVQRSGNPELDQSVLQALSNVPYLQPLPAPLQGSASYSVVLNFDL